MNTPDLPTHTRRFPALKAGFLVLFVLLLAGSALTYVWAQKFDDRIGPNVLVAGVNVSNMDPESARIKIQSRVDELLTGGVPVRAGDVSGTLALANVVGGDSIEIAQFQVQTAVEMAFDVRHRKNPLLDIFSLVHGQYSETSLDIPVTLQKEKVEAALIDLFGKDPVPPREPSFRYTQTAAGVEVALDPGQTGKTYEVEAFVRELDRRLEQLDSRALELTLVVKQPSFEVQDAPHAATLAQHALQSAPWKIVEKNKDVVKQNLIDNLMIKLDGTPDKIVLGSNAILSVSLASSRCASNLLNRPLYEYLGNKRVLPIPFCNIINGGKHAEGDLQLQEFMIVPVKAKSFSEATQMVSEIYQSLKLDLEKKYGKHAANVGDEGGFVPPLNKAEEAFELIQKAIEENNYQDKVKLALDAAASEFHDPNKNKYILENKELDRYNMIDYYLNLIKTYKLISIEDPFDQEDYLAWKEFKQKAKQSIDDIFIKIDEFEAKKNIVKEEVKLKYNERIAELKSKKFDLQQKYACLTESADEKWEETKIVFASAIDSFKDGLKEIATLFKK